jgi:sulfur transfer complex TusBCD TusB component (DsrH family)
MVILGNGEYEFGEIMHLTDGEHNNPHFWENFPKNGTVSTFSFMVLYRYWQ